MMEEILAAALVGLSFSNVGVCILMAIGCAAQDRKAGIYFIFGRAVGFVLIGILFIMLGSIIQGYVVYFMLLFAVLSISFGILMLYEAVSGKRVDLLERITFTFTRKRIGSKTQTGDNRDSGHSRHHRIHSPHRACDGSTSNQTIVRVCRDKAGTKGESRRKAHRLARRKKEFFILGMARGATPCLKLIVLVPLLIVSGAVLSIILLLVFAVSSSVYPVVGFLGASLLDGAQKYSKYIRIIGAIIIIALGVYVPANHIFTYTGS